MKKALLTLLVLGVLAGLVTSRASPQAVIQKRINEIAAYGIFEGQEHPLRTVAKSMRLASLFADPCHVRLLLTSGEREFFVQRADLTDHYRLLRTRLEQLATKTSDMSIVATGERATATMVVSAMGREPGREDYFMEKHRVEMTLEQRDGEWLVTEVRNLDPIDAGDDHP